MPNYLYTVHSRKGMLAEFEPSIIIADDLKQAQEKIKGRGLSLDTIQEITEGIRFDYYYIDLTGRENYSYIYANSQAEALRLLINNGFVITSIKEVPENSSENTPKYKSKNNSKYSKSNKSNKFLYYFVLFVLLVILSVSAFFCLTAIIFVAEDNNNNEAFAVWMKYHNYPDMTFEDWKTLKDANALPIQQKKT